MSPMSEREVARRLRAERGEAEPPAELLARIKRDIPPAIAALSPPLTAAGNEARAGVKRRRWLLAASLVAALGAGELGWLLTRSLPPSALLESKQEAAPAGKEKTARVSKDEAASALSPAGSTPVAGAPAPPSQPASAPGGSAAPDSTSRLAARERRTPQALQDTQSSQPPQAARPAEPAAPPRLAVAAPGASPPAALPPTAADAKLADETQVAAESPLPEAVTSRRAQQPQQMKAAAAAPAAPAADAGRGASPLEIEVADVSGRPLSGVRVRIAGASFAQTRRTDAAGRSVFDGLGPEAFELHAELPGYLPYAASPVDLAGGRSLRIRLLPLPSSGIVTRRQRAEVEAAAGGAVAGSPGMPASPVSPIPPAAVDQATVGTPANAATPAPTTASVTAATWANREDVLDRLRRDLDAGRLPPAGTVTVTELVNTFDYGDPLPAAAAESRRSSLVASPASPTVWLGAEGALAPAADGGRRARLRFSLRARALAAGQRLQVVFSPGLIRRYREAGAAAWMSAERPARLEARSSLSAEGEGVAASWLFEVELASGATAATTDRAGIVAAPVASFGLAPPAATAGALRTLRLADITPSWQAASANLRLAFLAADFARSLVSPGSRGAAGRSASVRAAGEVAVDAQALAAAFPGDPRLAELARLAARAAALRGKAAARP